LSNHFLLKLSTANCFAQLWKESDLKVSREEPDVTESEGKVNVFILLNQILDGQEKGIESIGNHVDSEASGGGHWHWVGVDASESLLVHGVLRNGRGDLLLAVISHQVVLDKAIDTEHWLQVMNILSLLPLGPDVGLGARASPSDLGQLSLDVESEASELFNVHGFSGTDIFSDVLNQGLPDKHVLGLWLKGFQVGGGSVRGSVVLSWVFGTVGQNPARIGLKKWKLTSQ
jgi:hypothetical protein